MDKKQFENPTLLLVEHGETEFTDSGENDRIHGTKYDLPLTVRGHQQANKAAEALAPFDIGSLKHSPMKRSTETAGYVGKAVGQEPEKDEGLMPLDSGYMSGMTHKAAHRRIEYYVKNPDKPIPGSDGSYGDWWDTASNRMAKRLKETAALHNDTGQGAVDVLHSSEIASMPAIIRGDPPSMWASKQVPGPGKISAVEKHGGKWHFTPNWKG